MTLLMFDDGREDEYVKKYNDIIKNSQKEGYEGKSLHHVYPRSFYPEKKDEKDNHSFLSIKDHWTCHYLLWKHDKKYAAAFWFCYVYFKKHAGWTITDEEYEQLKKDNAWYRRHKDELKGKSHD